MGSLYDVKGRGGDTRRTGIDTLVNSGVSGGLKVSKTKDSMHDIKSRSVNEYGGSLVEKAGEKSSAFSFVTNRTENVRGLK